MSPARPLLAFSCFLDHVVGCASGGRNYGDVGEVSHHYHRRLLFPAHRNRVTPIARNVKVTAIYGLVVSVLLASDPRPRPHLVAFDPAYHGVRVKGFNGTIMSGNVASLLTPPISASTCGNDQLYEPRGNGPPFWDSDTSLAVVSFDLAQGFVQLSADLAASSSCMNGRLAREWHTVRRGEILKIPGVTRKERLNNQGGIDGNGGNGGVFGGGSGSGIKVMDQIWKRGQLADRYRSALAAGGFQCLSSALPVESNHWHYLSHRATNILCRLWCNPAPRTVLNLIWFWLKKMRTASDTKLGPLISKPRNS
ncbi:hypothetical protein B0H13DRAFT_1895245 [Mycena leptocephala]|nr:hypothetical protein B0H13DRAFT_1895245 [Mycena leptocephala]